MHTTAASPLRSLLPALGCACMLLLAHADAAAESAATAHAEAAPAKKSRSAKAAVEPAEEPSADESTKPAKPPKPVKERRPGARVIEDPMDRLRERLAERLGTAKTSDDGQALRVIAHSPPPSPATPVVKAAAAHAPTKKSAAKGQAGHAAHWDYQGDAGPQSWGRLKPEFAKCASGERQSPIDIRDGLKLQLEPVQFDYRPSRFRVIDNGHTVQVNVAGGNAIETMGRRYSLVQFHFHRPSEERIEGRQFDMVAHLVHKDIEGRLAVVAVLLDQGSAHPLVQTVWNNLPLEKGEEVSAKAMLDLNALLPAERSYFTYMGSLTTPPCSEGVLWMVMKQPVQISPEQIGIFSRLYPMNARPVQSASGRLIKESN